MSAPGPSPREALISRLRAPLALRSRRPAPVGGAVDHGAWRELLERRAKDGWGVDYAGARADRSLADYRCALATMDAASLGPEERMAFWINAYNASALGLVAESWPVESIAAIPGAFTRVRFPLAGWRLTLDEIEHAIVRPMGTPMIHFGLNCASVGCPPLRAYGGPSVRAELRANGRRYLADPLRGARADGRRVLLSRIFQWFAGDFGPIGRMPSALGMAVALARPARVLPAARPLLPPELRAAQRVGFLAYDWRANAG